LRQGKGKGGERGRGERGKGYWPTYIEIARECQQFFSFNWFTVVSRIVTFPDGFYPDETFPGKTFPGCSFSRKGDYRMFDGS